MVSERAARGWKAAIAATLVLVLGTFVFHILIYSIVLGLILMGSPWNALGFFLAIAIPLSGGLLYGVKVGVRSANERKAWLFAFPLLGVWVTMAMAIAFLLAEYGGPIVSFMMLVAVPFTAYHYGADQWGLRPDRSPMGVWHGWR